jgi:glycosyltransferase involved in cell wall biosynthesis
MDLGRFLDVADMANKVKGRPEKNILHIVEDLKVGGLEKVLASIVLSLDKTKYNIQVWCLARGGDTAQALIDKGISLKILNLESYYNPLNILKLGIAMKKERFQLIHAHGYFAGTFGRLAAILARVPAIIVHVHSTYYHYSKRNLLIEKFLSYFTDRIICVSQAVERFVTVNERIRKEKTCLIYNAVEPPDYLMNDQQRRKMRASLGFDAEAIIIAVVASLTANKGHGLLISSFQQIFSTHPWIRLLIVGDGPLRGQLETEVQRQQMDAAIVFTGIRKDVFELLQASDILVLPSIIREGLSLALIEAMSACLPVVGTAVGGIPEVIEDGENGFLVSPGSSEQLAEALKKLVNDQALRTGLGRRGRQIYEEKFTMPKMIQQIETLYDQLLAEKIRTISA